MRQGRVRLSSFMRFPTHRINLVWGVEARLRLPSLAHNPVEISVFNATGLITHGAWMMDELSITTGYLGTCA